MKMWCGLCELPRDYSMEHTSDKVLWCCRECDTILDIELKHEAVKADSEKPPVGWIPHSVLLEVAKVLAFGAEKYSKINNQGLKRCLSAQDVSILLDQSMPGVYVGLVTIKNLKKKIPNTRRDSVSTAKSGERGTKKDSKNIEDGEQRKRGIAQSQKGENVVGSLERGMGLLQMNGMNYSSPREVLVKYAEEQIESGIPITVTTPDKSEESFVLGATTASGFLKIVQTSLRERSNISVTLPKSLIESGRNNWRKGMEWSRMVDAALRHLGAWNEGEDLDPESGISHLAHCLCCIIFLLWYSLNGKGTDDRWKDSNHE